MYEEDEQGGAKAFVLEAVGILITGTVHIETTLKLQRAVPGYGANEQAAHTAVSTRHEPKDTGVRGL